MNIFLHEIKSYRKSTTIWTVAISLMAILYFSMFPALTSDILDTKKLFEGFPEAIRSGLGIVLDNFGSILGYYSFVISIIVLLGAIQAMHMGTSIISKELRDKTADFLLTKPVTRTEILTSKILAVLTSLIFTNIVYNIVVTIMANAVSTASFDFKKFFMISITLLFVQLIFMSIGIIISVTIPRVKSVLPISLGTVFGFYFISFLSSTASDDTLRYITPFKYFDASYIAKNGAYEMRFIVISIALVLVLTTASYIIYQRKDIPTV